MPPVPPIDLIRATGDALAATARAWLLDALRSSNGRLVGLAVGDSTLPLYGALPPDDPTWIDRRLIPIDELVPAPADPNRRFAARLRRELPAGLAARVDDLPDDPAALQARVDREGFAAILLGLGPDGHVAFNQPGSAAQSGIRIVGLTPPNAARLGDVAPADHALTIGIATMLAAEHVAVVVGGAGKETALARLLDGPEGDDAPASHLRRHRALTVIMDACD